MTATILKWLGSGAAACPGFRLWVVILAGMLAIIAGFILGAVWQWRGGRP